MNVMKCDRCGMDIQKDSSPVYRIDFPFSKEVMTGIYRQSMENPVGYGANGEKAFRFEGSFEKIHLCEGCRQDFEDFWNEVK